MRGIRRDERFTHTLAALFKSMAELHAKFDKLDSLHGEVHWSGGTEEMLQEVAAHAKTEALQKFSRKTEIFGRK